MTQTIKLHVLRHGQALHNLLAEQGKDDEVFDPELTDLGEKQARSAGVPKSLHGGVQFWVSPLRRCLQTACLALPRTNFWHVNDDLREIGGEKLCDSRMKKSDMVVYAQKTFPHVEKWDFSGVVTEDDELYPKLREGAVEIAERVRKALNQILELNATRDIAQFAWVSHSAFLSMLFAVLDFLPVEKRWLDNGQWATIDLNVADLLDGMNLRLLPFVDPAKCPPPSPVVGVSAGQHNFKLTQVDWKGFASIDPSLRSAQDGERIIVLTFNGPKTEFFGITEARVPSISVAPFPLMKKGDVDMSPHLEIERGVEIWQEKMIIAFKPRDPPKTPPYCYNATKAFLQMPPERSSPINFERIGLTAFSDCILVGESSGGLVADDVLNGAIKTARTLLARGSLYSVSLIFCEARP